MNTQKMKQSRTAKNNRSNNENSWNNMKIVHIIWLYKLILFL